VTYDREKYPMQFYMLIFFKALMALILYFFLTLIFFELMRRLFPRFAFFKEKKAENYDEVVKEVKAESQSREK
jgi:Na+-transporting methylmalonyl-CoA/oxaloacetate decarboxylase gamma subunit